jgi:ABC-type Fe3+-siderophore transport system permease subunit
MNKYIRRGVLAVSSLGLVVSGAFAQAATFDPTTYTNTLGTAATVATGVVGAIVALSAGLLVWGKVKMFFGRSK